jgi:hypothetical protein
VKRLYAAPSGDNLESQVETRLAGELVDRIDMSELWDWGMLGCPRPSDTRSYFAWQLIDKSRRLHKIALSQRLAKAFRRHRFVRRGPDRASAWADGCRLQARNENGSLGAQDGPLSFSTFRCEASRRALLQITE